MAQVDTSRDEEIARQLQEQEARRARTRNDRTERGGPRNIPHTLRMTAIASSVFSLPQILAAVPILSLSNATGCDIGLWTWCAVSAGRLFMSLLIVWAMVIGQRSRRDSCWRSAGGTATALAQPFQLFGYIWLITGSLWLLSGSECAKKMPHVYSLALSMVILQYSYLFLPLLILLLLLPLALFRVSLYMRVVTFLNGTTGQQQQGPNGRRAALSETELNSIGCITIDSSKFDPEVAVPSCSICLAEFENGEQARKLPCSGKHIFHKDCIDDWLRTHSTCPLCRDDLLRQNILDPVSPTGAAAPPQNTPSAGISSGRGGPPHQSIFSGRGIAPPPPPPQSISSGGRAPSPQNSISSGGSAPSPQSISSGAVAPHLPPDAVLPHRPPRPASLSPSSSSSSLSRVTRSPNLHRSPEPASSAPYAPRSPPPGDDILISRLTNHEDDDDDEKPSPQHTTSLPGEATP